MIRPGSNPLKWGGGGGLMTELWSLVAALFVLIGTFKGSHSQRGYLKDLKESKVEGLNLGQL